MRMTRPFLLATAASLAALFAATTIAEAQARRAAASRPLVVKKRSFLDNGKVVAVGSESGYVQAGKYFNRTPDYYSQRSRYGNETLPDRFSGGGRPLFTF